MKNNNDKGTPLFVLRLKKAGKYRLNKDGSCTQIESFPRKYGLDPGKYMIENGNIIKLK